MDALSGILLVEVVLRRKQCGLDDWDGLCKVCGGGGVGQRAKGDALSGILLGRDGLCKVWRWWCVCRLQFKF